MGLVGWSTGGFLAGRHALPEAAAALGPPVLTMRPRRAWIPWHRRPRRSSERSAAGTPGLASLALAGLPLAALLGLPLVGLIVYALTSSAILPSLTRPLVVHALWLSVYTTAISLVLTIACGTPIALLLARGRLPGASWLEPVLVLPMVLPPAVAGLALLLTFGRLGLVGSILAPLGVEIPLTTVAVVLAQLFVASPFFIRAAHAGFAEVPHQLEETAVVHGASAWRTVRYVTIPLALPSLVAGGIMAWARAIGEFGATIMFAGSFEGRTQTMPLAIYAALESDLEAGVALSLILLGLSYAMLLVARGATRPGAPSL